MNTQQTEKQEIFKNIETTGKKYINQFKILAEKAQKSILESMADYVVRWLGLKD